MACLAPQKPEGSKGAVLSEKPVAIFKKEICEQHGSYDRPSYRTGAASLGRHLLIYFSVSRNYKEQNIDRDECKRTAPKEEGVRSIVWNQKHS